LTRERLQFSGGMMKELLDEKIFQKFIENYGTFFGVLVSIL